MTEPGEWERQADQAAEALGTEVDGLEASWPAETESFRSFWAAVKDLNERIRTAPAIKLDDKLGLQHRVNELCHRARAEQRQRATRVQALEAELMQALDLAEENLRDADTIDLVQEIRADLALIRARIEPSSAHLRRSGVWERWQEINRGAWSRLTELWAENERNLAAILDEADVLLSRSNARGAKDTVKRFHAEASERSCSRSALKSLRDRAHGIWARADEVGRQKHERFLQQASGRVERWRQAQSRRTRQRASIERDIGSLEIQLERASTGVAQALLRGRIEERRKALTALEAEERELQRQIDETEQAISRG